MKTTITLQLRRWPVVIRDERTGEVRRDTVVLEKGALQAAQIVGQSSKELIYRIFNRQGYRVLDIGTATKASAVIDLDDAFSSGGQGV